MTARKIWRYTLNVKEQKLWDCEEMQGWRDSMIHCVEDEARDQGCKKYVVIDHNDTVVAKGEVRPLPEPEVIETA